MAVERSSFLTISSGKYIWVFGGRNAKGHMSQCEQWVLPICLFPTSDELHVWILCFNRYDTYSDRWQTLADMPTILEHYDGIDIDGNVYVVCKQYNDKKRTIYRPHSSAWPTLTHFNTEQPKIILAKSGKVLCIFVGVSGATMLRYDISRDVWVNKEWGTQPNEFYYFVSSRVFSCRRFRSITKLFRRWIIMAKRSHFTTKHEYTQKSSVRSRWRIHRNRMQQSTSVLHSIVEYFSFCETNSRIELRSLRSIKSTIWDMLSQLYINSD